MLDPSLIKRFRNKVNANSYYILHKYRNQSGENRWNIICSAMDWITVSVNNYNDINFEKNNIDKYCMQVYAFISTIDILFEAITQIYRVLMETKSKPFKGEKKIFKKNIDKDDNAYFKHIRAVFGAHSVDLNDQKEKWFASWPVVGDFDDYDLHVYLYPLSSDKHSVPFGLYLEELKEFAETRYNYLNTLIEKIDIDFEIYKKKCQQDRINFTGDPLKDAIICRTMLNQRLPNDYYGGMIEDIIRYLSPQNTLVENLEKVTSFLDEVKKALNGIKEDIQNLSYEERDSYKIFNYDYPSDKFYYFSKYLEVLQGNSDPLASFYFDRISDILKPYVAMDPSMDDDEIYLLIHVGLFLINTQ